jgi:hypothetical protein
MKTMFYIFAAFLILNTGSLFAGTDNDVHPGAPNAPAPSVKELAPVTPKEATFEDGDFAPEARVVDLISLMPQIPMIADFDSFIPDSSFSIERLMPQAPAEATFPDNF